MKVRVATRRNGAYTETGPSELSEALAAIHAAVSIDVVRRILQRDGLCELCPLERGVQVTLYREQSVGRPSPVHIA